MKLMPMLSILLLLSITLNALGETGVPVFARRWYTDADLHNSLINACGRIHYYLYNSSSSARESIESKALELKKNKQCGGEIKLYYTQDLLELTPPWKRDIFPGDPKSYNLIQKSQTTPKGQEWTITCSEKDITKMHIAHVYPLYNCLEEEPYGFYKNDDNWLITGCNRYSQCEADIVARDLNTPGLGWMGHVGMIFLGDNQNVENNELGVLEVLADYEKLIGINSFDEFYHKSPFWGERYGVALNREISQEEAVNIYFAGAVQEYYSPNYTIRTKYRPGAGVVLYNRTDPQRTMFPISVSLPGIFRCDTFVNYSYLEGANFKLPTTGIVTPKSTYVSLVNERKNGFIKSTPKDNDLVTPSKVEQALSDIDNTASVDKQETLINEFFSREDASLYLLGNAITKYSEDETVTRARKVKFLAEMLQQYPADTPQNIALIDALEFLKPIEYTEYLTELYSKSMLPFARELIIRTLAKSVMIQSKEDHNRIAVDFPTQQEQIKDFFRSVLSEESDTLSALKAIRQVKFVYPPEQAFNLIRAFESTHPHLEKNQSHRELLLREKLDLSLSTKEMERQYFPSWLDSFSKNPDKKVLGYLALIAAERGYNGVTPNTRNLLAIFFKTQWKKQTSKQPLYNRQTLPSIEHYLLLKGYSAMVKPTAEERSQMIADKIMALPDPSFKASLVTYSNESVLRHFTAHERHLLAQEFVENAERASAEHNPKAYRQFVSAVTLLHERNKRIESTE